MSIKEFTCSLLVLGFGMVLTACYTSEGYYHETVYIDRKFQQAFPYHLPNLVPRRTSFWIRGDEVIIQPRVENLGNVASGPFNVHVRYILQDSSGIAHPIVDLGNNPWASLAAGQDRRMDHTPSVSIADLPRPILLTMYVGVDIPIDTGGQVRESDETDNGRIDPEYIW
jgi:hypothetical protein